jgi:hypothetical protein
MNKTQHRIIEVKQCGVGHCPYCIPDSGSRSTNYCGAFKTPKKISSKLKTFPLICPLKLQAI